jgi:hypothetical protein
MRTPSPHTTVFALLATLCLGPIACNGGTGADGEICGDGEDNDGDGTVDEGVDEDGDTYYSCDIDALKDCDDTNAAIHPETDELCDGVDNDCNGTPDDVDLDGDGYLAEACGGPDCADNDPDAHPGRPESCDGSNPVDNDCDGEIDEGYDADDDGWTSCSGDCRDSDPQINPDATEICDGLDNNCNCTPGTDTNDDDQSCGPGDAHVDEDFDMDGDGYIDRNDPMCTDIYGVGTDHANSGDCDDSSADIRPGAQEDPNDTIDNDCDTCTNECEDYDGDGYDNCGPGDLGDPTCPLAGANGPDDGEEADCVDDDSLTSIVQHPEFEQVVHTPQGDDILMDELCDHVDNDCDGDVDEGYDEQCNPKE